MTWIYSLAGEPWPYSVKAVWRQAAMGTSELRHALRLPDPRYVNFPKRFIELSSMARNHSYDVQTTSIGREPV